MDQLRLISIHRGRPLPSIKFDSSGTKKIVALASYIVEALEKGKILIIDELDSGLQFKISREIISLFNNYINTSAQLICTTHDVSLLDIKTLFRKTKYGSLTRTPTKHICTPSPCLPLKKQVFAPKVTSSINIAKVPLGLYPILL